jgi:L-rhamnose isomerase
MRITTEQINELEADLIADHEQSTAETLSGLARRGIDGERVVAQVAALSVAAPSWAVGTGAGALAHPLILLLLELL